MKTCISCNRVVKDYVSFKCPSCGKVEIVRCQDCRAREVIYICPSCGFEGP